MRLIFCLILVPILCIADPIAETMQKCGVMPIQQPGPRTQHLILLDPGHGGFDVGARRSRVNEKTLTLKTALLVRKYLQEKGYHVLMTRMRDVFIPLKDRVSIANRTRCHLLVSIHYNAAKNSAANGIEVFYYKGGDKRRASSSKKLAQHVLHGALEKTDAENRKVKDARFYVTRESQMPAILVEGGFITHEKERTKLEDPLYLEKLAQGIANGIDAYFKS